MRHFLSACAIAALARGVRDPAAAAGLIAACGRALRVAPGLLRATGAAVDLPAIAPAAQGHLGAAAGAQEQTGSALQAALLGSCRRALDEGVAPVKYCPGTRAQRRVGAASVTTARLKGRPPRSFSTALRFLSRLRLPCQLPDRLTRPGPSPARLTPTRHKDREVRGALPPAPPNKAAKKRNPKGNTPLLASPPDTRGF